MNPTLVSQDKKITMDMRTPCAELIFHFLLFTLTFYGHVSECWLTVCDIHRLKVEPEIQQKSCIT